MMVGESGRCADDTRAGAVNMMQEAHAPAHLDGLGDTVWGSRRPCACALLGRSAIPRDPTPRDI